MNIGSIGLGIGRARLCDQPIDTGRTIKPAFHPSFRFGLPQRGLAQALEIMAGHSLACAEQAAAGR